jgi:hypothetical protein
MAGSEKRLKFSETPTQRLFAQDSWKNFYSLLRIKKVDTAALLPLFLTTLGVVIRKDRLQVSRLQPKA